ncbi:hypothetical protein CPC08DRAFT_703427 [Agrocybe pediades]|nr:hypothetical protein CPC08DRAFT_703427 [Agrocybe pediades]
MFSHKINQVHKYSAYCRNTPTAHLSHPMDFQIKPLISYTHLNPTKGHCCAIFWNLQDPPSCAYRIPRPSTQTTPHLQRDQYATQPPITKMQIVCGILPEFWPIRIIHPNGITVGDVLDTIHSVLHRRISQEEYQLQSESRQRRINAQFLQRCNMLPTERERAECHANGVLRVDFLLDHTLFGGLSVSPNLDRTAVLTLRKA